jgi:hypothetical protein
MPVRKAAEKAKKRSATKAAKPRAAAPPKKKAAPAKKAAKKPAAKAKAKPKAAPKKPAPAPKKKSAKTKGASAPPPRPSERALEISAQRPSERSLTDEERGAMLKVAATAARHLGIDGVPEEIVRRIGVFVDEVRSGKRQEPKGQDLRLGLGVLWGEQVRAQVGWRWVHLTYPNGFASYALVPDDRAFACFPLNRVPELMRSSATNTSSRLFQRIRSGELPTRRDNAYLVIG